MSILNNLKKATHNRRLAQWRVTWLIEHSTTHQHLWCIDSFVLRNPPLRQAPNRCVKPLKDEPLKKKENEKKMFGNTTKS